MADSRPSTLYDFSGNSAIRQAQLDDVNMDARLARMESVVPYYLGAGKTARAKFSPLNANGISNGQINVGSTSAVSFVGSMAPAVVDGLFAVASPSTTTATIYWDGTNTSRVIILRAADGTNQSIQPSSIGITGLTASLVYKAYAYWSPFNQCGLGWAAGTVGTPLIVFDPTATATQINQAISAQHQAGREPVGAVQWTQPASGSTPAGPPTAPPAPDPGSCVMIGTQLKPLGDEPIETENYRWEDWIRIETEPGGVFTRGLNCTPNHPLYDSENGKVEASFFLGSNRWIITDGGEEKITNTTQFIRSCTKVKARMRRGHLFFANGFLSHNIKANQL